VRGHPADVVSPGAIATIEAQVGRHDPASVSAIVAAYAKLASVPASREVLAARTLAVRSLLAHPSVVVALQAVLAAAAGDPTPEQRDAMWPELVAGVASLWDAVTVAHGRDLLMLEGRPKARDLLLESLAAVAPVALTDEQRAALVSDLIDLYPTLRPEQKPRVDRALATLGSSDLVEILAGRGLADSSHLQAALREQRALEETRRALRVPSASGR
jgi:hypothetical protein